MHTHEKNHTDDRIPGPTSSFERETSSQETFALVCMLGEPYHRKAVHKLLYGLKAVLRRKKEDHKLVMLVITELNNYNR